MNKLILTVIAVFIILAVLGAGAYAFYSNKSVGNNDRLVPPQEINPVENTEKKSLRDLMSLSLTQECQFTDTQTENSGTVYTHEGQMRGDFNSIVNGTTTGSHMILKNNEVYVWMDGQPNGFKVSLLKLSQESLQTGANNVMDPDKKVDYSCGSWTADTSKFTVPAIQFTDYSDLIPSGSLMPSGTQLPTGGDKAAQCAQCNSLPEGAKAQCLQMLACN